ncbi:hypothetical protein [Actinoplanes sp. NPDC051411]|uniref:hypothetical protein n=1 Tax=Actinoplanes sp. NPDC051411 TaxID=3155522 RepID=UPI0034354F6A
MAVIVLAAGAGLTSPHAAFAAPTPARGAQNCASAPPQSKRVGAWMCVDASHKVDPKLTANRPAPLATTTYCITEGCYYRYSDTWVQFAGYGLYYFYGDEQLGEMFHNFNWYLNGTNTTQTAAVDIDHEVDFPEWSGSLFNGAAGVNGSVIHDCTTTDGPAEVPGGVTQYQPPGFCTLSDNRNYDHNMVLQYSWQAPDTSGYYWVYAKSVVAHSGSLPATSYIFNGVSSLPANPASQGWDA